MSDIQSIRLETTEIEKLTAHIRKVTDRLIEKEIARGAGRYKRERDLPKLIKNWQSLSDAEIIQRLEKKARAMATLIARGHYAGDTNLAIAIWQALKAERQGA